MEFFTEQKFKMFAPTASAECYPALFAACKEFKINTPRRLRHFLSQLAVESVHFTRLVENLNYSAKRLVQVWPNRFPDIKTATNYASNPRQLANKIYGGRMGNIHPDDGYKYRGRGYIQLTGRENYTKAGAALNLDLVNNPDLAATHKNAARIAAWYWASKGINEIVDRDANETVILDSVKAAKTWELDDVKQATYKINGGYNGLEEREFELYKAAKLFPDYK